MQFVPLRTAGTKDATIAIVDNIQEMLNSTKTDCAVDGGVFFTADPGEVPLY